MLLTMLNLLVSPLLAQYKLSAAAGYHGYRVSPPGFLLEFEYEKFYKDDFSAPLRTDITFISDPDFTAVGLDLHKGFRKYFKNGLLLEQSVGAGIITSFYKTEMFYYDQYTNGVSHGGKPVMGFMPSATLGIGYNITNKSAKSNLIWIRPKVYWDLGFRGLNMPYYAIQVGYTYNFKSK